jgi:putative flippase GtrA
MFRKLIEKNTQVIKYLIMACCIVALELTFFEVVYRASDLYQLATVASFVLAVILNWIGSRKFVFSKSRFSPTKEFTLVLIASLVGLAIQLGVVYVSVEIVKLYPLFGKVLSIAFSFFWNYWFRAKFIFGDNPNKKHVEERAETAVY